MNKSFTTFWNDTVLKHQKSNGNDYQGFTTFWNDTVLKQLHWRTGSRDSFTTFWNDTVLKPQIVDFRILWHFWRFYFRSVFLKLTQFIIT